VRRQPHVSGQGAILLLPSDTPGTLTRDSSFAFTDIARTRALVAGETQLFAAMPENFDGESRASNGKASHGDN
jgi:hypothetical protein